MLGILDSGEGGENTARELRRILPEADILLFCDREHLPYGTKSERELIGLVTDGVKRLLSMGAVKILLACCTASSIYHGLGEDIKEKALPIIEPVIKEAREILPNGRLALLATERTVGSGAFGARLGERLTSEIPAGRLVCEIEAGARDGDADEGLIRYIEELLLPLRDKSPDGIILGCTHFSSLEGTIKECAARILNKQIITVNSAKVAAKWAKTLPGCDISGEGRLIRI